MQYRLTELSAIARDVVRGHQRPLEVVALIPSPGGGGAAELLVTETAEHASGLVSIPISRHTSEAAVRSAITDALDQHFGRA